MASNQALWQEYLSSQQCELWPQVAVVGAATEGHGQIQLT